jgi:hypothetical protein
MVALQFGAMPLPLSSLIAHSFFGRCVSPQHVWRLGELDVVIADDLYAVAPGIEEIEKLTGQRFHARLRQCTADRFLIIDNESKMPTVVGGLKSRSCREARISNRRP